ncbi:MAG: DUF2200 domain-containing protein, partial [Fimbriimonadales bacterium]|nr:DUF2200 domain-containing protein [Fimbriimonadales bacterium]
RREAEMDAKVRRVRGMSLGAVYPLYVAKVQRKGRTAEDVRAVVRWMTGFSEEELDFHLNERTTFERFFEAAPSPNPARLEVKGKICGVAVEAIEDPIVREVRILDKLVDELAKGRPLDRVLDRSRR